MYGTGDRGHGAEAGVAGRHRRARVHDARPCAGDRRSGRETMSKSKRRVDAVPSPEAESVELPEAWKKRPWVPYLIMGIVIAAVLGSGLALQQAVTQPRPLALANCTTSTATGPYAFIAAQPICIL